MFRIGNEKDIKTFWDMFKSNAYPSFFRHIPKEVNRDQFKVCLTLYGGLVVYEKDNIPVGYCMARYNPIPKQAEIAILIPKKHQYKGYALELMKEGISNLIKAYDINRIVAIVPSTDSRINKLLLQGGFEHEGIMKESCSINGQLIDENRYSLTINNYKELYVKE